MNCRSKSFSVGSAMIKHILADGREVDTIDGFIVKRESAPELYEYLQRGTVSSEKRYRNKRYHVVAEPEDPVRDQHRGGSTRYSSP